MHMPKVDGEPTQSEKWPHQNPMRRYLLSLEKIGKQFLFFPPNIKTTHQHKTAQKRGHGHAT